MSMEVDTDEQQDDSFAYGRRGCEPCHVDIDSDDIGFILGKGGRTKEKICLVSGSEVVVNTDSKRVIIYGRPRQQKRAKRYVELLLGQMKGVPQVTLSDEALDQMTIVTVPDTAVAWLTGKQGSYLRDLEEERNVLLLWVNVAEKDRSRLLHPEHNNTLAILGHRIDRTAIQMKVVRQISGSVDSYLKDEDDVDKLLQSVAMLEDANDIDERRHGAWGADTVPKLQSEDVKYAIGTSGKTREKLAMASGCILEFIKDTACFVGYRDDRKRGREYVQWLIEQRNKGTSSVENEETRGDCSIIDVDTGYMGFITGPKGASLSKIEHDTKTFIFAKGNVTTRQQNLKRSRILVFSHNEARRDRAIQALKRRVDEKDELDDNSSRFNNHRRNGDDRHRRQQSATKRPRSRSPQGRKQSSGNKSRGRHSRSPEYQRQRNYKGSR